MVDKICSHVILRHNFYLEDSAQKPLPKLKLTHVIRLCLPTYIRTFLSNPQNEDNLNNFEFNKIASYYQWILSNHQNLVLAGGFTLHEKAVLVHARYIKDVQELYCNQEEADTRIWFHVKDYIVDEVMPDFDACFRASSCVQIISDIYDFYMSIKADERKRRTHKLFQGKRKKESNDNKKIHIPWDITIRN